MKLARFNLVGDRFGRLTVIEKVATDRPGRWWRCLCDCGNIVERSTSKLRDSRIGDNSCGCARRDSIRKAHEAAVKATTKWRGPHKRQLKWMLGNMKKRCLNPRNSHYRYYGARGIRIHQPWLDDSSCFYQWGIESGYERRLSIDRIDPNGNYEPDNCRFVPLAKQAANTRRNRFLTWNGCRMHISGWAKALGVRQQALQHRVDRHWPITRIFTQAFRRRQPCTN